jgi:hypothetical protein
MTLEEEQRIAIAVLCGFIPNTFHMQGNISRWESWNVWAYKTPGGATINVPDYLNDLNAMHEAEKMLDRTPGDPFGMSQYDKYWGFLREETDGDLVGATATQRAKAFLRAFQKRIE